MMLVLIIILHVILLKVIYLIKAFLLHLIMKIKVIEGTAIFNLISIILKSFKIFIKVNNLLLVLRVLNFLIKKLNKDQRIKYKYYHQMKKTVQKIKQ
jgi:hypothetical protein